MTEEEMMSPNCIPRFKLQVNFSGTSRSVENLGK